MNKRACNANELRRIALCFGAVYFLKAMSEKAGGSEDADALAERILDKMFERFGGIKFRGADACELVRKCAEWLGIEGVNF